MKDNSFSQSGLCSPRVFNAIRLYSLAIALAMLIFAAPSPNNSTTAGIWSIVTSPNTSTTQNDLLGVTCVSPSDCWTVGSYVAGSGAPRTLIEHWDGTAWAIVPSPNASLPNNVLSGVTCVSASDCWAVGYYITGPGGYQSLIERWVGTSWAIVTPHNA